MIDQEVRQFYHGEQYKYCCSFSRADGFIYCDDCFFRDSCRCYEPDRTVEYCWMFRYAPKEVQQ